MKKLINMLTANLPDWLNPVYVKELRQTLHSKSFLIISGLILLVEFLLWYAAKTQFEHIRQELLLTEAEFAGTMLHALLAYVWLLGSVALLQPAISRWTEERQLDAVSPERTTNLSVWVILRGKLWLHVTLLSWVSVLSLPLFFWLYPKVEADALRGYLCVAGLSFLLILNLNVWSTIVAMHMRIRRNVTGGIGFFGWFCLSVGTIFILLYQGVFVGVFKYEPDALKIFVIAVFPLVMLLAYGGLLLVSVMKPEQSNRMFPARLGGYLLCGLTVLAGWGACKTFGVFMSDAVTVVVLLLIFFYIAFQSMLVVFEPLYMPERMKLDAPGNIFLKAVWYLCGTGSFCAWIHLLIPFAVVSALLFLDVFQIDIAVWLAMMLIFVSYSIVYGVVVYLVRLCFPKLNGGIILVLLCGGGWIIDVFLVLADLAQVAYVSPVTYCVQRLADLMQGSYNGAQEEIIAFASPVLIITWVCVVLMLILSVCAENRRKQKQLTEK